MANYYVHTCIINYYGHIILYKGILTTFPQDKLWPEFLELHRINSHIYVHKVLKVITESCIMGFCSAALF